MITLQEKRANWILNKKFDYGNHGGILTRKEFVEKMILDGAIFKRREKRDFLAEEKLKNKIDKFSNFSDRTMYWYSMHEDMAEQEKNKELLKKGIFKTFYQVWTIQENIFDLTKTEFDFYQQSTKDKKIEVLRIKTVI